MIPTSLRHVWFCSCWCRTAHGVRGTVLMVHGCCSCHRCGTWVLRLPSSQHMGVAAAIIMAHGHCSCHLRGAWVLWPLLSRCMGVAAVIIAVCRCCGRHCRGTWVLRPLLSRCVGVAAAIIAPHGCCSYCHCAVWGVVGAVVAPCGSCPHHMSSLSLPSIVGPSGPSRKRVAVYVGKERVTWLQKRS
jgi:hypothetical protein